MALGDTQKVLDSNNGRVEDESSFQFCWLTLQGHGDSCMLTQSRVPDLWANLYPNSLVLQTKTDLIHMLLLGQWRGHSWKKLATQHEDLSLGLPMGK